MKGIFLWIFSAFERSGRLESGKQPESDRFGPRMECVNSRKGKRTSYQRIMDEKSTPQTHEHFKIPMMSKLKDTVAV